MAMKSSSRGGKSILWIVVHTAEGARTKESLKTYFERNDIQASSHAGSDAGGVLAYVDDDRAAWTLRSGNPISLNIEMCGFARWKRAQWLSEETVDGCKNPKQMVINTALWVKAKCEKFGIDKVKLTPAQVGANRKGVIGHYDYTIGKDDGSHTDPGVNFPWDFFMSVVNGGAPGQGEDVFGMATPQEIANAIVETLLMRKTGQVALEDGHEYNVLDTFVGTNGGEWEGVKQLKAIAEAQTETNEKLDALIAVLTPKASS